MAAQTRAFHFRDQGNAPAGPGAEVRQVRVEGADVFARE
jgi:hypothetical protein